MFCVEEGSGNPQSNAYVSIEYVETYLVGDQLTSFTALTECEKETVIISSSRYIDSVYEWKGTRKSLEQGLAFPRIGMRVEGFEVTGVPAAIKRAVAEGTRLLMDNPDGLFGTTSGQVVASERVEGAVSQSFFSPSEIREKVPTRFEALNTILKGLYRLDTGGSSAGCSRVERV